MHDRIELVGRDARSHRRACFAQDLGSRCAGCGTAFFPQATRCPNPGCPGGELVRTELGRTGRLHSWTVQAYQPPALFAMGPWAPYVIGRVEIPEGLRVLAIVLADPEALRPELPLRLTTTALARDAAGRAQTTYAYRPA